MPFLVRDGVKLAYEDVGSGGPALLFLHRNSCNHQFFRPQIDRFGSSRRVVALDLRGHGQSDAPRSPYTFAGLADDCAWLCGQLGLKQIVVVGHSMGGAVAAELVKAQPGLVRAMVALDSTLMPDPVLLQKALPPLIQTLAGAGHMQGMRDFVEPLFAPGDSREVREWVWREMTRTPGHVTLSLFQEFMAWRDSATPRITQPFLYVAGFRWRSDAKKLARACPQVVTQRVKESGHFLTLTATDKVNEFLGSLLEQI
jgi:pimeloyl-ACP methyl ester carboxylesterase